MRKAWGAERSSVEIASDSQSARFPQRGGVKPSWNYFIEIWRLSKHFVARTRDIAWRSFYYFSPHRTFCTTDSISSAAHEESSPLCPHAELSFGIRIGIAPRFLSKFNKRSNPEYHSRRTSIFLWNPSDCILSLRIEDIQFNPLPASFYYYIFIRYNILLDNVK